MKSLKGFKEVFIEGQLKLSIVDFSDELFVSADVAAIPWCYNVDYEISVDKVRLVYKFMEIPEIGKVEVVGSNIGESIKVINIKYSVKDADSAINTYYKVIKYIVDYCNTR
ncbi:MAG: hypothetical protein QXO98_02955 [Sulfolobales archaeon]